MLKFNTDEKKTACLMKTEDRYNLLQIFLNIVYESWMEILSYNMQSIPLNLQRALIMINVAIFKREC